MDAWTTIQNPTSGMKYSIFSTNGRELLKSYLRLVKEHQAGQAGGEYRLDLGAEPVAGLPPVAGYDGCDEAAQVGGEYRLDLGAEPVAGLPPVVGYDGCDEAVAQTGGDYFLNPSAEPVGGQAEVVGYRQVPHNPPHPTPTDANNNA